MDTHILLSSLKTCITSKSLQQAKLLHQKIITLGLQTNLFFTKHLINLYISCQSLNSANLVFQTIQTPLDITLWNTLMSAYTKNHMYNQSLHLYQHLHHFPHLKPDSFTYPSVLKACGGLVSVKQGKMIHTHVVKSGFASDVVVASSLVGMYAKCGLFDMAVRLFDEMPDRDVPSWNTVISCYYQDGQPEKALEVFEVMKGAGFEPNSVTFTTAISACTRVSDLDKGKGIHRDMMRIGFQMDRFVSAALIDFYGKCGCLDLAREVFEEISRESVVLWNSMIVGYSLRGDVESCLELFWRMNGEGVKPTSTTITNLLTACSRSTKLLEGKFIHGYIIRHGVELDEFVSNSLIDLYFKCGSVASAEHIFRRIPKINVVSWNVMISGYVMVGCYFEALRIFSDMREVRVSADSVTFTSVLQVCSQLAALEQGKEIHGYIIESKLEYNEILMGALLDMYAKCGAVDEAHRVFDQLPERDFVSWTSMIAAYGSHGRAAEALELFHKMEHSEAIPDRVTFLAVMSACSHAGLVDEGCYYFSQMTEKYGIKPTLEHYSCLVDLLGRAGKLYKAYDILQKTPSMKEDAGLLSTLFSACNMHKNLQLGEEIARLLIEKDPDDPSTYLIMSNMYASLGRWDEVSKIRMKMKELRLRKLPGCSWIEVDKRTLSFYVEDKSHPQSDMIYESLANLIRQMEDELILYKKHSKPKLKIDISKTFLPLVIYGSL